MLFRINMLNFRNIQFLLGNNLLLTGMVTREKEQHSLTIEKDKKLPSVHLKLLLCLIFNV